jgi:hypothetical protein
VTITTSPTGLASTITYNGLTTPPITVGSYTVVATITQSGYSGNATGVLTISDSSAAWKQLHFSTTSNTGSGADDADPDGDKLTNIQEYIFGTIPTSPEAPLLTVSSSDSQNLTISFFGRQASGTGYSSLARHYRIEKTLSLSIPDWQPLTGYEDITAGNSTISITQPTSQQSKSFYRLKSWLQ